MISADVSCIESRDEKYWHSAYTLISGQHDRGDIPEFLQDMAQDIVTCGKSINLLRICSPQHFMCNLSESEVPSISMTLSQTDLKATEKYCQMYTGRIKQIAKQITVDRYADCWYILFLFILILGWKNW